MGNRTYPGRGGQKISEAEWKKLEQKWDKEDREEEAYNLKMGIKPIRTPPDTASWSEKLAMGVPVSRLFSKPKPKPKPSKTLTLSSLKKKPKKTPQSKKHMYPPPKRKPSLASKPKPKPKRKPMTVEQTNKVLKGMGLKPLKKKKKGK